MIIRLTLGSLMGARMGTVILPPVGETVEFPKDETFQAEALIAKGYAKEVKGDEEVKPEAEPKRGPGRPKHKPMTTKDI